MFAFHTVLGMPVAACFIYPTPYIPLLYTIYPTYCSWIQKESCRKSNTATSEFRRVTRRQRDSITRSVSLPAATLPKDLRPFSLVIYAYIPAELVP